MGTFVGVICQRSATCKAAEGPRRALCQDNWMSQGEPNCNPSHSREPSWKMESMWGKPQLGHLRLVS